MHLQSLELGLGANAIGDAGAAALAAPLGALSELQALSLDLEGSALGATGCTALAHAIGHLKMF